MSNPGWIGKQLGGRYRIDELLGQGGMSSVYKAFDPNLRRVVAIKLIHPHLASDPKFIIRFEEEATSVAQLRHPNIVQIHDFNHDGDLYYMVQEYIPGETVQERVRRLNHSGGRMPFVEVVRFAINICDATDYAHRRGMIHRDIKPANIMIDLQSQAILMDFGIVKIVGGEKHTATGAVVGTARYLSPEMIRGETTDGRADMYSLGVTLYEMISGRPPFEADSAMTLMMMHLNDRPPDLRSLAPDTPAALVAVIERTLLKERDGRFATMSEMGAALRSIRSGLASNATIGSMMGTAPILTPYTPPARTIPPDPATGAPPTSTSTPTEVSTILIQGATPPATPAPYVTPASTPSSVAPRTAGDPSPAMAPRPSMPTEVPLTPVKEGQAGALPPASPPVGVTHPGKTPARRKPLLWFGIAAAATLLAMIVIGVLVLQALGNRGQARFEQLAQAGTETAEPLSLNLPATEEPVTILPSVSTDSLISTELLTPTEIFEQDEPEEDTVLKQLAALNEGGYEIKQVAFTRTNAAVILYGFNSYWHNGIPEDARYKLSELYDADYEIKSIAFAPNMGWVILWNQNDFSYDNVPQSLIDKLTELSDAGEELKQVSFSPDSGWVILANRNDAWWEGIPDKLGELIEDLYATDLEIKSIAFTPAGGWVIIYAEKDFSWEDIPESAINSFNKLFAADEKVKHIAFTPTLGWVILYGYNGYTSDKVP